MSNLEYITQARNLLTEDYRTKHINEYNSWLAKCKDSWMQPHSIVPFPPFLVSNSMLPFKSSVSAPSEEAVVAKALELYKQFNPESVKAVQSVIEEPVIEPVIETVREPITSSDAIQKIFQQPVIVNPIIEPVVVETIVEPIVEEAVAEETVIELAVVEPIVKEPPKTADAIYKIFQTPVIDDIPTSMLTAEPLLPTIEAALNVVPQPAEELAKVKNSGRILPAVLEKLQAMKDKWSAKGESNV